ncbi:MAG: gamma-glutamyltransferase [Bacteroidota bacterium]
MTRRLALPLAVLLVASACQAQRSPTSDPVRAENGMVVSAEVNASEAGVAVMQAGGNAVDAAVATGFALAVTFPVAGNIGGGGFMVIRFPDGTATTIDYRETAPSGATRDMYVDDSTGAIRPDLSRRGHLASGVPGAVAGLLHAHETYGSLPLADVIAPAIRLAEGYPLSRAEANLMNAYAERFAPYPGTVRAFTKAGGFEAGETFRQPDLAATLRRIRDDGRDGFYRGETAALLVAEMERGGGLITRDDLAGYEAVEREPLVGDYRGHRILSMPPPSSGGVALIQMLDAVEPFDVAGLGFNSSASVHLMGEAMRRAFADRAEYLGDPDFSDIPTSELIDEAYTRRRMADFDPARADSSVRLGAGQPRAESAQTTHYSVVDDDGMAVSVTTTLNGGFGSLVVVEGAGFFLNNEMDDFTSAPGEPNMFGLVQGEANAIAPGKRMLSSMTPTIVEDPEGRLMLVIGSPGGPRIITTVYEVILNVIDHGMDIQEAVAAPRVHHQWLPDVMFAEHQALALDVIAALVERGWSVRESDGHWSRADGIRVRYTEAEATTDPSGLDEIRRTEAGRVYFGGADPRGEDVAVGY